MIKAFELQLGEHAPWNKISSGTRELWHNRPAGSSRVDDSWTAMIIAVPGIKAEIIQSAEAEGRKLGVYPPFLSLLSQTALIISEAGSRVLAEVRSLQEATRLARCAGREGEGGGRQSDWNERRSVCTRNFRLRILDQGHIDSGFQTNTWRKVRAQRGCAVPRGRRGHTALVHRGQMLIYGGYQDLRGSSPELWAFHFGTCPCTSSHSDRWITRNVLWLVEPPQKRSPGTCFRRARADRPRDTSTRRCCTATRCTSTVGWRICKRGTTAGAGTSTAPRGPCWRTSRDPGPFTATRRAGCRAACSSSAARAPAWRPMSFGDFTSVCTMRATHRTGDRDVHRVFD